MDIQRRLDRKEAAQFLTAHGYRTAPATLAKLACIGGGPAFESFGPDIDEIVARALRSAGVTPNRQQAATAQTD